MSSCTDHEKPKEKRELRTLKVYADGLDTLNHVAVAHRITQAEAFRRFAEPVLLRELKRMLRKQSVSVE